MKINVGSKNSAKVNAVKEIIEDYDFLSDAEVISVDISSGVSEQPKSLNETIEGAKNRAREAFVDCDYSFGIESGLMKVPHTKTGFMNICFTSIYDGKNYHLGASSLFEYPLKIMKLVNQGLNVKQALVKSCLTKDLNINKNQGGVGILTKKRLTRKTYTQQSITMALIHLDNSKLY